MAMWWEHSARPAEPKKPALRAVAYYRHSAQDRQENSVSIQQEQVRLWAKENMVEIIQEFADKGKSGLTAEGRDAFNDMMENWVKKRNDFQYILCLDVSRWGRFQDIDLSATYSAECKRHGKLVIYTSIGKPRENDPLYPVYVQFERFRAAQYSKELSDKVFRGCVMIARQGFWAGGKPPYGLCRQLLNEARQPVQILSSGERKSIQNQRVTLAIGDGNEVATVHRIFAEFTESGRHEKAIADDLNRDGIPSPAGCLWDDAKVRHILTNELYIGTLIYNKTTQKLKTPSRRNPEEQWVRTADAFEPIVDKATFAHARKIIEDRELVYTPESMLERLKEVFDLHGVVRASLMRGEANAAPSTYTKHFGSLDAACQRMFQDACGQIKRQVEDLLREKVPLVEAYGDFLVVNRRFTVLVQPSIPLRRGYSEYWFLRPDTRNVVDITLGVPVSNGPPYDILGYLALPRLLVQDRCIRLFSSSESRLDMYGHDGLEIIQQLTK